ncbi:uncharacterized protein ACIB01_017307 isoform 1-T1 [Guaruba guarouba]
MVHIVFKGNTSAVQRTYHHHERTSVWGNQELNRSFSISTHFQGGPSQTKISSQNMLLEELGLTIWQRTFDKKSCKMLLLRTTCSLTHCLDRCTVIAGLELAEFWVLLNCI